VWRKKNEQESKKEIKFTALISACKMPVEKKSRWGDEEEDEKVEVCMMWLSVNCI